MSVTRHWFHSSENIVTDENDIFLETISWGTYKHNWFPVILTFNDLIISL